MKTVLTLMLTSALALTGCSAGINVGTTNGAALPVASNSKDDNNTGNVKPFQKQQVASLSSTDLASNQIEH